MASITQNLIEQVQIDTGNIYNLASTAYGVCSTAANVQEKTVEMRGFYLNNGINDIIGVTIHVKFEHENTAANPTLNVQNTGAYPIVFNDSDEAGSNSEINGWQSGAVLTLTYDGTSWVRDQGYNTNTDTTYSTLTQNEVDTGTDTTGKLITAKIIKDTLAGIDTMAAQIGTTENKEYSILLKNTDNTTDETASVKYSKTSNKLVTINPSTGILTAPGFSGSGANLTDIPFSALIINNGNITNNMLSNSSITVAERTWNLGDNITAATLRLDLGLSNALHFIGITSTNLSENSTTSPLVPKSENSLNKTSNFEDGDVVMDNDQLREYVWVDGAWHLLGITTSEVYTQPATITNNTWISQIVQGTDGRITATTGTLVTSGLWTGNAGTATALETSRTIQTNLASDNAASFDGTANITPGVTGILPIGHGGTGTDISPNQYGIIYASSTSTYASTSAGAAGQVLISNNSNTPSAPSWYTGLLLTSTEVNSTTTYNAEFGGSVSITTNTTVGGTLNVTGTTTLLNNLTVTGNIIPSSSNIYNLGIAANGTETNARRWGALFVGTADSYGDIYSPVYWNSGVPAIATSHIQYNTWEIKGTHNTCTLSSDAFTIDTYVLALVIKSGASKLNAPLHWASAAGTLTISTDIAVSGSASNDAVTGYVITTRGSNLQLTGINNVSTLESNT